MGQYVKITEIVTLPDIKLSVYSLMETAHIKTTIEFLCDT